MKDKLKIYEDCNKLMKKKNKIIKLMHLLIYWEISNCIFAMNIINIIKIKFLLYIYFDEHRPSFDHPIWIINFTDLPIFL